MVSIASRLPSWRIPSLPDVVNEVYLIEFRKSSNSSVPAELVQIRNLQMRVRKCSVAFNCTFAMQLQGRGELHWHTGLATPSTWIATLKE